MKCTYCSEDMKIDKIKVGGGMLNTFNHLTWFPTGEPEKN